MNVRLMLELHLLCVVVVRAACYFRSIRLFQSYLEVAKSSIDRWECHSTSRRLLEGSHSLTGRSACQSDWPVWCQNLIVPGLDSFGRLVSLVGRLLELYKFLDHFRLTGWSQQSINYVTETLLSPLSTTGRPPGPEGQPVFPRIDMFQSLQFVQANLYTRIYIFLG